MTLHTPFSAYGWFTAALASRLALRATASGGFGDDNGVGFGKRLQPGGQVRCFADHSLFPGCTRSDQIADHRQSSGETDPHLQRRSTRLRRASGAIWKFA